MSLDKVKISEERHIIWITHSSKCQNNQTQLFDTFLLCIVIQILNKVQDGQKYLFLD